MAVQNLSQNIVAVKITDIVMISVRLILTVVEYANIVFPSPIGRDLVLVHERNRYLLGDVHFQTSPFYQILFEMSHRYNFYDLTFVIPIHIDSIIRVENLLLVIDSLIPLNANIIIHECNKYENGIINRLLSRKKGIRYIFTSSEDIIFHRTMIINKSLKYVETPFLSVWDADVIVSLKQIEESMKNLRNGTCDVSFPYDGNFLNVDRDFREVYCKRSDIRCLYKYNNYFNSLYSQNFVGGGFIINREKYILAGGENEKFYGWGPEDLDRVLRWTNLGYRIHRSGGPMFHLDHPRDENGIMRSKLHNSICNMQIAKSKYSLSSELDIIERL